MKQTSYIKTASANNKTSRGVALGLAILLACGASFAEKPEWAGKGGKNKGESHGQMEQGENQRGNSGNKGEKGERREDIRVGGFFGEQQRVAANSYYGEQFSRGRCPPGLAKKNNGCLPPGQAKKYSVGQPLPRSVVYYPVPGPVIVQLGTAPAGYKYVRVASDILLIALGTNMVVDAIQDLGRI